ncbi:MAG: hypothetical protein HZT43_05695 [Exiguobacterium profundum]|nr:MAG: hypothetical protein HZT43_05695 [Exiguobacterium profundum]
MDSISDVVDEAVDAGTDLVFSYVSLILSSNVEMLTLREAAYAIAGTGNDLGNRITGNSNANALLGLDNDTLFGEAGTTTSWRHRERPATWRGGRRSSLGRRR